MSDTQSVYPYIVRDLTGDLKPQSCKTLADAEAWVRHLMEWRPRSRPVIERQENALDSSSQDNQHPTQ